MAEVTSTIVSAPIEFPAGVRMAKGTITLDTGNYATGGVQTSVAQWTGGSDRLPQRFPDFVLFNGGQEGQALTSIEQAVWKGATGRLILDEGTLTDDVGIAEEDNGEAQSATVFTFLAIWVNADGPAAVSTALLSSN